MLLGISNNNVLFDENRKYEYLFRGETVIIAPTGTEEGISKVSITGRATIIGTQKCGAVLYLKQIEITQGLNVSLFLYITNIFSAKLQNHHK